MKTMTVSVAGASGYTGLEAIRLLLTHPAAELNRLYSSGTAGKSVEEIYPALEKHVAGKLLPVSEITGDDSDVMILGLPHGISAGVVARLLDSGYEGKIIDMGSDFRLRDPDQYRHYYGKDHPHPDLIELFVYGLTEFYGSEIGRARYVANPGCFATAMQLAMYPLVSNNAAGEFWVTGVTGSSGSGAGASAATHFSTRFGNLKAYKVFAHQHLGEVRQSLQQITGQPSSLPQIHFVPVSGPFVRGIWMTLSFACSENLDLSDLFGKAYSEASLIRFTRGLPELKSVAGSAWTDIGWVKENGRAVAGVAIDNLVKGAAGQAIQNMNLMSGLEENTGLLNPPVIL